MNPNATETRLREIAERENKATNGPWRWTHDHPTDAGAHMYAAPGTPENPYPQVMDDGSAGGEYGQSIPTGSPDALFIAHSRQDVPWLLALIKKQREALECYAESTYGGDIARDALNFSPENL